MEASSPLSNEIGDLLRQLERAVQVDVERDERLARAENHAAGGRIEPRRPEIGPDLAGIEPALKLRRTAAAVVRRPTLGRLVDEHGDPERADPLSELQRHVMGPFEVRGHERHDRDDVGGSDPGVRPCVLPQVDQLTPYGNRRDERLDQLAVLAHEREDRAVVVDIGMDVEQPRPSRDRVPDRGDRRGIATLGEVRNGLEQAHALTLGRHLLLRI